MRWRHFGGPVLSALLVASMCFTVVAVHAATASFVAVADATLFQESGSLASGAGPNLFVGRTGNNTGRALRRALVRFDLTSLPAGAVISTASVQLSLTRSRFAGDLPVDLHRVTAAWTEGPGNLGSGAGEPAQAGDVTWSHRSYPLQTWASAGADHVATPTASRIVATTGGPYVWPSSAQMVADVQAWAAAPASNHGWLMRGFETGTLTSAKAFATRETEAPLDRPTLVVEYTIPVLPAPDGGDIPLPAWALGLLGLAVATSLRRRGRAVRSS